MIQALCETNLLHIWTDRIYQHSANGNLVPAQTGHPRYVASTGITAVAKALATNLDIWRSHKAIAIAPTAEHTWSVTLERSEPSEPVIVEANALVVAIPAPQALALLEPLTDQGLSPTLLTKVRSVEFAPCISAIARYSPVHQARLNTVPWQAVTFADDWALSWVGIDSHKRQRPSSDAPLLVIQSSTAFAERHLDAPDLQPVGQQLLECAARSLLPWLASPDVLQVHRWRYAFASRPLQERCLPVADPLPLVCSGDWCGGNQLEHALESGLAAADNISFLLNKTLPNHTFARLLQHISH